MTGEPPRIGDYAVIGDGRSAALVSNRGSIDWLSWPRFDSPSVFAALLDRAAGGSWRIAPVGPARSERYYLDDTNVLRTRFRTETGTVSVTDFMPAMDEADKRLLLLPENELIRLVECEEGVVELASRFDPRPDYATRRTVVRDCGPLGLRVELGSRLYTLRAEVPFAPSPDGGVVAHARLSGGQAVGFSLSYTAEGPAVLGPLGDFARRKLDATVDWWRRWAARSTYQGPHRNHLVRSALVLKLLAFAPSGAIVAAPTTSLPERVGGDLNWDYRYCWPRDAALTARALFGLGYADEATAFVSWLLHATRLTRPRLGVLYDVYGRAGRRELELGHLAGYRDSRPVRVGNAARAQLQLDTYGEVIDAVAQLARRGGAFDRETRRMLAQFGAYVCGHWSEPDSGLWEPRGPRRHYTHTRALCWAALNRLLDLHAAGKLPGIPAERFARERDAIREGVEAKGWDTAIGSYTQVLDGDTVDASLLLLPFYGFADPASDRMRRTRDRIAERLGAGPGLMYRYEESRPGTEGAFAACSFWDADCLARSGDLAGAERAVADTLRYANDVGLFAEEIDPATGEALGNFPQAYTHVGLINAALSLAEGHEGSGARDRDSRLTGPVEERAA
ncbi:MAG TPA: glycoside hydrolase family 15 protein [Gemmataceae bacterium]|nr:glycoside hydrolase family 15 protein [Gemmataceae bacterium]